MGVGGQAKRVPAQGAGASAQSMTPNHPISPAQAGSSFLSDTTPDFPGSPGAEVLPPDDGSGDNIPLSHYKGVALANVGRDRHGRVIPHKRSEVTARKVALWVAGGATPNDIAVRLNIRPGLVKECYGLELEYGQGQVNMDMAGSIIKRAKKSDRLAVFYAKARMGWRDGDSAALDVPMLNIHIHN